MRIGSGLVRVTGWNSYGSGFWKWIRANVQLNWARICNGSRACIATHATKKLREN